MPDRVVPEEDMAPLVLDHEEGGHQDRDEEGEDDDDDEEAAVHAARQLPQVAHATHGTLDRACKTVNTSPVLRFFLYSWQTFFCLI